ncbi:MAG: PEP-CTERM sorting domain-containing protein [Phycisphaeraceae bacterium]|nr:PEP-CTERM sorting domain-containing protein [Phycisphaeraceae bacterium]
MKQRFWVGMSVVVALCLSSSSWASPVVDGSIAPGEYATVITDVPGEVGYDPAMNIASIYLDSDASWNYLGLDVVAGAIANNGGPSSFLGHTLLLAVSSDNATPTPNPLYRLIVDIQGANNIVALQTYIAGNWVTTALNPADYAVSVGSELEVKIATSVMSLPGTWNLAAQLDDTGSNPDDQLTGLVPEPSTLALLALGTMALLRRRAA